MRARLLLLVGMCLAYASVSGTGLRNNIRNQEYISTEKTSWRSAAKSEQAAALNLPLQNKFLYWQKEVDQAYAMAGRLVADKPWQVDADLYLSQSCCPDFILKDAVEICPPDGACIGSTRPDQGGLGRAAAACKNTPHTYTVYPNDPSYTFTWTITGGSPASYTGNPVNIVWGSGATGIIKVVISNLALGGTCIDSITREFCLIDGPVADFTVSPDTVCQNTPVNFTNTSIGGSVFFWDFGDGTTSTLASPPPHSYALPGNYTVLLKTTDMGAGHPVGTGQGGEAVVACGCSDTATMQVVVLAGTGPEIVYDCCFGTVCAGDTSSFCTPMVCGSYNWTVTGGSIISGNNTSCIKIKWNPAYTGPTTVSLQSCPSSSCQGITTLEVPVLYPNLPISGPSTVCVGSSGSFSLPWMPGTYYTWSVNGPGLYSFNKKDRNVTTASITFNNPGLYWVKCVYNNPLAGCNGVDSIPVNVLPIFNITGDETVCEGSSIQYYSPVQANWSVSPPGPVISGNGSPIATIQWTPGNYVITAVSLIPNVYCNDTAYLKVKVIAKPILGSIQGTFTACPGSKHTFSISSNTSGSDFIWPVSPGVNVLSEMGADSDSIVAQLNGPGPWQISVYQNVEISPGNFCPSLTQTLNISPYPTPVITGTTTVCVDAVVQYTASGPTPPGGFQWSISPSNRGTIQSGQGTNTVNIQWHGPPTTAALTVSHCSGSFTLGITINTPPVALATYNMLPVFCLGDNQILTLSTPTGAGYSYQWYLNNTLIPTETNNTININIASLALGVHQYHVVVTLNGCSIRSNIVNVKIESCNPGGPGTCDVIANFWTYPVCDTVFLVDQSTVSFPNTIILYQWSVSGPGLGNFSPNANFPSPYLTVNASGQYTITLTVTSSSSCTSTFSSIVNILLPNASFTFTSPVCQNSPATFNAIPNNPAFNYAWTFGDAATSFLASTQHAYANTSPPSDTVILVITDQMGCIARDTNYVNVDPLPVCTISASDTIFCPGSSVTLTACNLMTSYQWYKNGNAIPLATAQTYSVTQHGEYYASVTNSFGCSDKTNSLYIYMNKLPKAKIQGNGYVCAYPGGNAFFNLTTVFDSAYIYSWTSNPPGAIFSPGNGNSPWISLTLPGTLPAVFDFIVNVTDTITGCTATDTLCIWFYETPTFTLPTLNICEGNSTVLSPSPVNPVLFDYLWNTGQTTPVITASSPGFYSLTVTNKSTGCDATMNAGFIFSKPDLSLFPLGCDSICDTDTLNLYIPLPLNAVAPYDTYPTAYPSITWYETSNWGTPLGYGENLPFTSNVTGNYQIAVVVSNNFNCVDTAGVFCLKVKNCPPYYGTDFGDVPDDDVLPGDFPTLLASNGARHLIAPGVFMGSLVDPETNGQPSFMAVCDDNDCIVSLGDDEDGVTMPPNATQGSSVSITVVASVNGFLDAWMDFNLNSDWSDPGEHIFINQALAAGSNTLTLNIPASAGPGICYSRFRFRTTNNPINFFGPESDGEVEDYALHIDPVSNGEMDFGDVPDDPANPTDYPTYLSGNGARHSINPLVFLGSKIDAEGDGQPTVIADGDDINASDDEDGIAMPAVVIQASTVNLNATASVAGFLDAWIDFNVDGDWADAGEQVFAGQPLTAGLNPLSFIVPVTVNMGPSYARFRFRTSSAPVSYDGLVADGEVEDYAVFVEQIAGGEFDFGDAPDNPETSHFYPTLLANNGARHNISPNIYMGSFVDPEINGQPSIGARCDDVDCFYPSLGDDEDGVTMPLTVNQGATVPVSVVASVNGYLDVWADFNIDGDWADTGEHIFVNQSLIAGSNNLNFTVPVTAAIGATYLRFRFRSSPAAISYDGLVFDGEVEDHMLTIVSGQQESLDFGDVPDNPLNPGDFPTLLGSNGARHAIVPGIYLGTLIDAEADGQPTIPADGDDLANLDDEDGVSIPAVVYTGTTVFINVNASVAGYLDAWIDLNGNGTWGAGVEHIFTNQAVSAGSNSLSFNVPGASTVGQSYARFRFRTSPASIGFNGLVADGEVEDYAVYIDHEFQESFDFGDVPDNIQVSTDYPTYLLSNGARHLISPAVYLGSLIDAEGDGQPNFASTGDDLANLDDEDGVIIPAVIPLGSTAAISISASTTGFLDAWLDLNIDGDWADAGEHIFNGQPLSAGLNSLSFTMPVTATTGQSYSRFRFRSTAAAISYDGFVADGEVEDYGVYIEPVPPGPVDFGDVPDEEAIATDYPTLLVSNGARHTIVANVFLGTLIDAETDGQPTFMANGDDVAGSDDEDGITMPPFVLQGSTVTVTATASVSGFLDTWMDFNTDGDWSDAGEHIFITQALTAGSNTLTFNVPVNAAMGPSYSRFRFRTTNAPVSYDGLVSDGEVEDYAVYIEGSPQEIPDFGDAPDNLQNPNDYPTYSASNGASHIIANNTYLGLTVDGESDGQPTPAANGDNLNNINDQDGITFLWPMSPGNPCKIKVVASVGNALFNMWIDYNGNGSWADAGDHVFTDINPTAGNNYFTFIVPGTAIPGPTFARFRFSHQPALSFAGPASDGEVEDYRVTISKSGHKWHQLPDDHLPGLHSGSSAGISDDWICNGGLVTQFDWWGNYEMTGTGENRGDGISHFEVNVYGDADCQPDATILSYSIPFAEMAEVNTGQVNAELSSIYKYSYILPVPFAQIKDHKYWLSIRAISVNAAAPAQWRWQEANRWVTPVSCPSEINIPGTGWQEIFFADPDPGQFSDLAFSVINSQSKTLNLKLYLEGLYNGNSVMRKAQSETGDQFPGHTADQVTIELHNSIDYSVIEHTFSDVEIATSGDISVSPVPENLNGDYYVTVKHRNSIETTSASPVSFSESDVTVDFSESASSAFGNNLLIMIDGQVVIYSGDINQDGTVDTGDVTPLDNDQFNFVSGYVVTDLNGDGTVDTGDVTILDNNSFGFVGSITP
ncbi:MAG: PKD domain-containing protein [Bacteroidales bacterium]|nr:PKD domain-containing protein [Bacteroidales bacterium]